MDTRDLKIELLTIRADGCKKHPAYKALRPATGRCSSYLSGQSKICVCEMRECRKCHQGSVIGHELCFLCHRCGDTAIKSLNSILNNDHWHF